MGCSWSALRAHFETGGLWVPSRQLATVQWAWASQCKCLQQAPGDAAGAKVASPNTSFSSFCLIS